MAVPRTGFGAACWQNKLYAVGGDNGRVLNSVEALELKDNKCAGSANIYFGKNKWAPVAAAMSTPRSVHGVACSREGKLYALGGRDESHQYLCSVEVLDLQSAGENQKWTRAASMVTARAYGVGVACWESKLYAVGGFNKRSRCLKSIEVLDLKDSGAEWKLLAPDVDLNEARCRFGLACWGGKLYAAGGSSSSNKPMCGVEVLDLSNISAGWARFPSLNTARRSHVTMCWDGKLYALGGRGDDGRLASVEVLDLASPNDGWVLSEQAMLRVRSGLAAVVRKGVMYAIGGYSSRRRRLSSVERLCVRF